MGNQKKNLSLALMTFLVAISVAWAETMRTGPLGPTERPSVFSLDPPSPLDAGSGVSLVTFTKPTPLNPTIVPTAFQSPSLSKEIHSFAPDDFLKPRVDFWIQIYTKYNTSQGVIHDAKYVDIVYQDIDFQDTSILNFPASVRQKVITDRVKVAKKTYETTLRSIHTKLLKKQALSGEEQRVHDLFNKVTEPNKFLAATQGKRIRFQLGQKDRFLQGLFYSGRYLKAMEKIFKDKGLPLELTRLPFVESSFNVKAQSKVGASGLWQFMRSTGKFFMKINDTVDERNDPIRATEAAAQFMANNYAVLGKWPLALTAYNHGTLGMVRAVQKVKSQNLADIILKFKSGSFGFASSNFYAEFLAAVEVERNVEKYFGKIEIDRPIEYAEFVMTDYIDLKELSSYTQIPLEALHELNPSLTDYVLNSQRLIPAGYVLRIPVSQRDSFLVRYNDIPGYRKFSMQKGPHKDYIAANPTRRRGRRAIGGYR